MKVPVQISGIWHQSGCNLFGDVPEKVFVIKEKKKIGGGRRGSKKEGCSEHNRNFLSPSSTALSGKGGKQQLVVSTDLKEKKDFWDTS